MKICIVNPGATDQLLGKSNSFGGAEERSINVSKILNLYKIANVSMVTSRPVTLPTIQTYSSEADIGNKWLSRIQNKLSKFIPFVYPREGLHLEEGAWDSDVFVVFGVSVMAYSIMRQCKAKGKKFIMAITSDDCLDCGISIKLLTEKNPFQCPRWIGHYLITNAAQVWVQSFKQEAKLFEDFNRRGFRIPNPAPFEPISIVPLYSERSGVFWIGKASEVKDPLRGLKIASQLPHIPFTFVINNSTNKLGQDCYSMKPANVTIIESVKRADLPSLLMSHRVLINTSVFEGMPNAFIEAWAHGMPVISLSACKNIFDLENCPGVFADSSDNEMIRLISDLYENEKSWQKYSDRTQKFLKKNHSTEALVHILQNTLKAL